MAIFNTNLSRRADGVQRASYFMKNVIKIFVLALSLVSFVSCDKLSTRNIIGRWDVVSERYYDAHEVDNNNYSDGGVFEFHSNGEICTLAILLN